ncbi:MAG: glycosyltransferase [Patescibacteria group bacterium]|nr:glycosyltransferase [Patescibacteria group bacterium]
MNIGIDISQLAYPKTGVAIYLRNLVEKLVELDKKNEYILFFSSLRRQLDNSFINGLTSSRVKIKMFHLPPTFLAFIWNQFHVFPIEYLIGNVDIFISSDWTQPPTLKAKKATILYDLIVYKYPEETHNKLSFNPFKLLISPNIVETQKRRMFWVKNEADIVFCISQATKDDAKKILGIDDNKLKVIHPGI